MFSAIYVTVFPISNTMLNLHGTWIKLIIIITIIIQIFPTTTRITIYSKYFPFWLYSAHTTYWRMTVRSNFEAEIKDKLTVTWNKVWHCSCKLCIGSATRLLAVSYQFKQRHFWPTHVNLSKCLDAIYQIWIANCFYFHRENRLKNLFKINAQIAKSPFPINDRPASLKKSRCLNSLGWPRVALSKEGRPLAV